MLGLADIKDWLKTFNAAKNYYVGKLDNKKESSIGVYQRKDERTPHIAVGGRDNASFEVKSISILLHHNNNAVETEKRAMYLYNQIMEQSKSEVVIGKHRINVIELLQNEPIDVGTDDNGIYERVIEMNLYYELKEREEE